MSLRESREKRRAGAVLILAVSWLFSCSIQDPSLTTVQMVSPKAKTCGTCHVDIFNEWRRSKHASAYLNPRFQEQTFGAAIESCMPCHIPETILTEGREVRARTFFLDEGVTCIACHLIDGEHHGPFFPAVFTPHAAKPDPERYRDPALCGTCHLGTYKTWSSSNEKDGETRTCQECHMEAVRRKITQATGFGSSMIVALHDEHDLRRHTFDASVLPGESPVAFRITAGVGSLEIEMTNLLPHSIPTGDFGFRKVRLTVTPEDEKGRPTNPMIRDFFKDLDTDLKAGGTCTVAFPREKETVRVRAVLERVDADGVSMCVLVDEGLELPPAPGTGGTEP